MGGGESFPCYDNSDVIATLMMTNFPLNTTVVAIFPNACLWRRSLCSDLVLTLKNRIEPPSYARTAYVCCNMALISFRLFRKNLGNLRDFFGQMVYRPPLQKISRTPMLLTSVVVLRAYALNSTCLHEGGGPQEGEVTRLSGVTRLSIQSLILM